VRCCDQGVQVVPGCRLQTKGDFWASERLELLHVGSPWICGHPWTLLNAALDPSVSFVLFNFVLFLAGCLFIFIIYFYYYYYYYLVMSVALSLIRFEPFFDVCS